MDWKLRRAIEGAYSDVMTQHDLEEMAIGKSNVICLQPVPTLSVGMQHFNTLDIWHAVNQGERPPVVERLQQPVDLLIWRKGHSPHFRSLSKIESAAISCVSYGFTLDEIGAVLERAFPDADIATEFGVALHRWLDDQILNISLPG